MQKVQKVSYANVDESTGALSEVEELVSPIPIIRTHFNSKYFPKKQEKTDKPSLTVPDQAMSVQELIKRFASGLPLTAARVPLYDGEEETIDLDRLDLVERKEILDEARREMLDIDKRVKERRMLAEKQKLDEIIERRVAERESKKKQIEELEKEIKREK